MRRSQPDRTVTTGERSAQAERDNRELRQRLTELTDAAARNEALLRKTQERELELLRAGSLAQLLELLIHGLRSAYQLDLVALVLSDPQHEIRHLLAGDGFAVESLREVQFVDAIVTLAPQLTSIERPWLGPYRTA